MAHNTRTSDVVCHGGRKHSTVSVDLGWTAYFDINLCAFIISMSSNPIILFILNGIKSDLFKSHNV